MRVWGHRLADTPARFGLRSRFRRLQVPLEGARQCKAGARKAGTGHAYWVNTGDIATGPIRPFQGADDRASNAPSAPRVAAQAERVGFPGASAAGYRGGAGVLTAFRKLTKLVLSVFQLGE